MKFDQDTERFMNWGTAQEERYLAALMPENLRVDGRALHEYIAFCVHTADLIQYFNFKNVPEGTWIQFLERDPSIFLALLANERPQKIDNEVRNLIRRFYLAHTEVKKEILADLINILLESIKKVDTWYQNSITLLTQRSENWLSDELLKVINGIQSSPSSINKLWGLLEVLEQRGVINEQLGWKEQFESLNKHWGANPDDLNLNNGNEDQLLHRALEKLRQTFQTLHFKLVYLNQKAPEWLQISLQNKHDHEPHVGLLLAFIHLFLHARDQLNTYPQKHLDHYYFDCLRQKIRPHVPDRSVVCFQLADQIQSFLLPKGNMLLAGVNEVGLASMYATTEDAFLSDTKIAALQTLFVSRSALQQAGSSYRLVSGIYAAPVADSKDGLGAPFESQTPNWATFGEDQLQVLPRERQMVDARVGFVLAAPIFSLQEGDREIELQFRFVPASLAIMVNLIEDISSNTNKKFEELVSLLFSNALKCYASTATGWFQLLRWKVDDPDKWMQSNSITLTLLLGNEDPAIVDHLPETIGETYDTTWPLLKIELNPDHNVYLYSFVNALELETIQVKTRVLGLKSLTLINEIGLIDSAAPFLPFGPIPNANAYLLIGCQELFKKRLTELSLNIDWNNLPDVEGGLSTYFQEYNTAVETNHFQVQISALSNAVFQPHDPNEAKTFALFQEDENRQLVPQTTIKNISLKELRVKPDYHTQKITEYKQGTRSGYLKLRLRGPKMVFGHAIYPQLLTKAMIEQAQAHSSFFGRLTDTPKEISFPQPPFTPQIAQLSIDYTATTRFNFMPTHSEENDEYAGEKIISLFPFGQLEIFANAKALERHLFPRFDADGYLYIGLDRAKPNQTLSFFVRIQESKNITFNDALNVQWSFLHLNQWESFSSEALLADNTKQFTTSGIVKLRLPSEIQLDNSLMPPGRFWLRATALGNLNRVGRVLAIQCNAVEVVWVDNGDPAHFDPKIARPTIQNLVLPTPEIAGLSQVRSFFGDRPAELPRELYVRTSERLRHKNRAINNWDVEHLILDQFPDLRQVKCVGPMQDKKVPSGGLHIVVVPKAKETELEPSLGFNELNTIAAFIQPKLSPFVQLRLINPTYEKIKISAKVLLKKELETERGLYLNLLHQELRDFICPWLRKGNLPLGGQISKNAILDFIKARPYLEFVTGFSLVHIYSPDEEAEIYALTDTAQKNKQVERITASTSWNVLVPVEQHNIQFIDATDHSDPTIIALEGMRLGTDFIVGGAEEHALSDAQLKSVSSEKKSTTTTWYLFPK